MRRFNLLDEPWIWVLNKDGKSQELSLKEVFCQAADLRRLANELPTLDVAILRLLLAILHASLARNIKDYNSGIDLWREFWKNGLPTEKVCTYLEQWRDRFWLVDDKNPFYQVAFDKDKEPKPDTEPNGAKLNGELSESGNKDRPRQFPIRIGNDKNNLSFSEATRWLIYTIAYDDNACNAGPVAKGELRIGLGWLGRLGLLWVTGCTLLETLLFNFVLLDPNSNFIPWEKGNALWEINSMTGRRKVIPPKSQLEILTFPSRRMLLKLEGDYVTGYKLFGGDSIEGNVFSEQMTVWGRKETKNSTEYYPKLHDPSKQLWRDFGALTGGNSKLDERQYERVGVLKWLDMLVSEDYLSDMPLTIYIARVVYGSAMKSFVEDIFFDSLSFNASLLTLGSMWNKGISDVLVETEEAVRSAGTLAVDIAEASGDRRDCKGKLSSNMKGRRDAAKSEACFRLDLQFRTWLAGIVPKQDYLDSKCDEWREIVRNTLLKLGEELVKAAGIKAFIGHDNKNTSNAYNKFLASINKTLHKTEVKDDG